MHKLNYLSLGRSLGLKLYSTSYLFKLYSTPHIDTRTEVRQSTRHQKHLITAQRVSVSFKIFHGNSFNVEVHLVH